MEDLSASELLPGSPTTIGVAPNWRIVSNDGAHALEQQMAAIFMNLNSAADSRLMRIEECVSALMDTLFAHSSEIQTSEAMQACLLSLVEESFDVSVLKGCRSFEVVFDLAWKDQHEKRSQCLQLLIRCALKCTDRESCAAICDLIVLTLEENRRTTMELLEDKLNCLYSLAKCEDLNVRAATCEVLARIVTSSAFVIKRTPILLDSLIAACSPEALLTAAVMTSSRWHRDALINLLTEMSDENYYEVTPQRASAVAELLTGYIHTVHEDSQLVGVLSLLGGLAISSSFASAPWDVSAVSDFLVDHDWSQCTADTRRIAACTTGKVAFTMCYKDTTQYERVFAHFVHYIRTDEAAVAIPALEVLLKTMQKGIDIRDVSLCVLALQACLEHLSFYPFIFEVIEELRRRYPDADLNPIYSLVDEYLQRDQLYVNFGKLNGVLRFAHDRVDMNRPELRQLNIGLEPTLQEAVLIRSLPLLCTLHRTNQLNDAIDLMFHDGVDVRAAAISTVISLCGLIISESNQDASYGREINSSTNHSKQMVNSQINYAVERILDVAVADRMAHLRFAALHNLTETFYPYLSVPDNLEALFMARNDIDRATRDEALLLLCRLCPYNPATVRPHLLPSEEYMLRDVDLQDASVSQAIYKTTLLSLCAKHDCLLIPSQTVESVALKRLSMQPFISNRVSTALLELVQSILDHSGPEDHCDGICFLEPVLRIVNGGDSSKRRRQGLETLCAILTSIPIPDVTMQVEVYRSIARIIRWEAEEDEGVLLAAFKALSTLGAVSIVTMRPILRVLESDGIEEEDEVVTPALAQCRPRLRISPRMVDRYPSVLLYYFVKDMQLTMDPRLQVESLATVRAMLLEVHGNQKALLMTQLFPQLQLWLADPEKHHLYELVLCLMSDLAVLLRQSRDVIAPSIAYDVLQAVQQFCARPQAAQRPLSTYVVEVLDHLAQSLPAQDMRDHRWAVEFIHQRLSQNKNDLELVFRVVKALESFLVVMHEKDLQLILPHVLQCVEPAKASPPDRRVKMKDINDACFGFLRLVMVKQMALVKDCCAQVVHTIMWYIELSDNREEMDLGLNTLAMLVDTVKMPAKRFILPIERVAVNNGYELGYFVSLVKSVAASMKLPSPSTSTDDLNPDYPILMTSHLPRLSQSDFEGEMRKALRTDLPSFCVDSVAYPNGQSVVRFHFLPGATMTSQFGTFLRKAQDTKSTLRRALGILRVEQGDESPRAVEEHVFNLIAALPSAKSKKREQSWIAWVHNSSVLLLRNSPYAPLRSAASLASRNSELSRDLFPFAVAAAVGQCTVSARQKLMSVFTQVLEDAPNDIRQVLFGVAEFMESERGEQKAKLIRTVKEGIFNVERPDGTVKFGINYDQDPSRGIVVTKLAPGGLGAKAGVPLGGQLLAINGNAVAAVSEIRGMIEGHNHIALTIRYVEERREKMEQKALIDLKTLSRVAFHSMMHAKAIYFSEAYFDQLYQRWRDQCKTNPNEADVTHQETLEQLTIVIEHLIEFYGHLNLFMEANGLVRFINKNISDRIMTAEKFCAEGISSLEQLQWWSEALTRYRSRVTKEDGSVDMDALVGVLRCEDKLGQLGKVSDVAHKYWSIIDERGKKLVAPLRAKAAFALGHWSDFDELASQPAMLQEFGVVERCAALFRTAQYDALLQYTESCREEVLESFTESFNESYERSYDALIDLQHLRHFEELVSFIKSNDDRKDMLRDLWFRRLGLMAPRPEPLKTVVSITSLVLSPDEDVSSQVAVIQALTKSQWYAVAGDMLHKLLGPSVTVDMLCEQAPEVIHAYARYMHATEDRHETYTLLTHVLHAVDVTPEDDGATWWGYCWLLLGEWTMSLHPERGDEAIDELMRATELSPGNSAAFHSLGILHYDLSRDPTTPQQVQTDHHISSVIALFKSVQLSSEHSNSVTQDVLRILAIWFAHGNVEQLNEAVHHGIQLLEDHVWLTVIPQLIARIGITARMARAILADLLIQVGTHYPQALIYPLTVAEKSPDAVRRLMAERVLGGIRVSNKQIVEEASLISNEMVRMAILWTEKWHTAIQQAAFKPDNIDAITKIFAPLYTELDHAVTPNERNFEKTFGQTLRRARVALEEKSLDRAWAFLKQVYVQLNKMLGERRLSIADVSPILDSVRDSIVDVPGTFEHGKAQITIRKFHPRVYVMPSKQKPRRFGLDASNGDNYRFLLKGHEDMRQDERVMQFIGLIDKIFLLDSSASSIGLSIPMYAVIPLTDNVGIIGWVENTETIYKMLETHRRDSAVSIYEEVNLILKKGGLRQVDEYHRLSKQQRKALLSHAIAETPDDELKKIMWDRNDTCEQWLSYREEYGHTLAAMSMVGYVLGLGDRHLNNLMLSETGTVVHIDFGDCFEVAMHRALYAEAVPFRLTRLLVKSLGVAGVDGVYRLTSEMVMKNLRKYSENLLSMLEAFIYDPLINWRLTANDAERVSTGITGEGDVASTHFDESQPRILKDGTESPSERPLQLSKSFAKPSVNTQHALSGTMQEGEEETRNQQGDLALARVHAKLTGQDFGVVNSSFSFARSNRRDADMGSSWGSSNNIQISESPSDPVDMPFLTTYLSLRALTGGADCLDVPRQVHRLIQEATSLENLADAYLTGWAPFW